MSPATAGPGGRVAPPSVQTTVRHQSEEVITRTIEKIGAAVSLDRSKGSIANTLTGRHSWSEGGRHLAHLGENLVISRPSCGMPALVPGHVD